MIAKVCAVLAAFAVATSEGRLLQQKRPIDRIVGGEEVDISVYPFIVDMIYGGSHRCAGSIYNENWIITAAHCVVGTSVNRMQIAGGKNGIGDTDEETQQLRDVAEIIYHEDYSSSTFENDIALLRLEEPLELGLETADRIILPGTEDQGNSWGGELDVIGWGAIYQGGPQSPYLQHVVVPWVSDDDCRDSYGQSDITDSMVCAGEAGKDSCQGDSGGPIVGIDNNNQMKLVGIVSWGRGCAQAGYPGVYSEVAYFLDWITDNVQ